MSRPAAVKSHMKICMFIRNEAISNGIWVRTLNLQFNGFNMQRENQKPPGPPKLTPSALNDPTSEANRGGADAVNDTPGIAAHGTTPGYEFDVVKPKEEFRGAGKIVWLAAIVALGIILAYAAGMLR